MKTSQLELAIEKASIHYTNCPFCNGSIKLNNNFIDCAEGNKLTEAIEILEEIEE